MDIVLIVLRLLHIVSAFAWVGIGAAATFYILPAAINSNESGLRFLKALFSTTNFGSIIAMVSGLTTLAGLLLYAVGNAPSHFTSTGNIVLGIGALAGLLATIHGGAVVGRTSKAVEAAIDENVVVGQSISNEVVNKLMPMLTEFQSHARLSMVLMIIALVCMGSARYL